MAGPDLTGLVNPTLLAWARTSACLDVEAAAARVGTSAARLQEWEAGTRVPTLNQVRSLAAAYKRSMGVFFLREIPKDGVRRPVDYRRFELSMAHLMGPALAAGLRDAEAKREAALDIYNEMEDEPPRFDFQVAIEEGPERVAEQIAQRLGITMEKRRRWGDEYAALSGWRSAIEAAGVMVIQLSGIDLSEMRGAAISATPLPVILLNSSDSPLARLFSMLHELTHLVRSESALCDEIEDAPRDDRNQAVEVFCNHVAGALLVPSAQLLRHDLVQHAHANSTWTNQDLMTLRRVFWASREVVLRRLLILGRTSQAHYGQMRAVFQAEYAALRERQAGGFVPVPRKVILGNGRLLTELALAAYNASAITGAEVSRILGTKLNHLPQIADMLRERAPA